jgi:hypothetical protein
MKQTAIEWLVDELILEGFNVPKVFYDKAKEMEKEQIIEAYNTSFLLRDKPYSTAEKYYNETYESNT